VDGNGQTPIYRRSFQPTEHTIEKVRQTEGQADKDTQRLTRTERERDRERGDGGRKRGEREGGETDRQRQTDRQMETDRQKERQTGKVKE